MSAAINRSITTIKTELEFLQESNVITDALYDHILSLLPERYIKGMAPANIDNSSNTQLSITNSNTDTNTINSTNVISKANIKEPLPPPVYVEAIYDFNPQQSDDLLLTTGDKIQIISKPSDAWWKGSCNGKIGMFPSNYVKPYFQKKEMTPPSNPPPSYYQQSEIQKQEPSQQQQQQYYQQQPPQQYYEQQQPVQQYYQQQQQPPQQIQMAPPMQVVQTEPQQQGNSSLKKFGSKLGNAAIFGAGATIGSDIVNSIF
jgi:hypothetical protein